MLVDDVAWLLRRLPAFRILPGDHGLRPIHVEDLARLAVDLGERRDTVTLDAVGPETFRYVALVRLVAEGVGSRAWIVRIPRGILLLASRLMGRHVDVPITRDEVHGLAANLLVTEGPPTGRIRFSEWLREHAGEGGAAWANDSSATTVEVVPH